MARIRHPKNKVKFSFLFVFFCGEFVGNWNAPFFHTFSVFRLLLWPLLYFCTNFFFVFFFLNAALVQSKNMLRFGVGAGRKLREWEWKWEWRWFFQYCDGAGEPRIWTGEEEEEEEATGDTYRQEGRRVREGEMPPIDAGVAARIVGQREVMISLAGLCLVLLTLLLGRVNSAVILLTSSNETWSFPDAEANFGMWFFFRIL